MTDSATVELEEAICTCGSTHFVTIYRDCPDRRHWTEGTYDVVQCTNCRMVLTSPRPTAATIGVLYPASYTSFNSLRAPAPEHSIARRAVRLPHELRWGRVRGVLSPPAPGHSRILDIGCGVGALLAEAAAAGWDPWGIEPNGEAAVVAARLSVAPDQIFGGAAEQAAFPDGFFDLITASHVLEHLHDPVSVLRAARRWLREDGQLQIRVPNFDSVERRLFGRYWFGLDVPRHLFHFTPSTLGSLLESEGFDVGTVKAQWFGVALPGSLQHLASALRRSHREYRHSHRLYLACLPMSSMLAAAGNISAIEVVARPVQK